MSRWIDADTLRSKLMQYIGLTNGFDRAFSEAPSIDIVRCGECEHRGADYCYKHSHRVTDSDFCSYGERKEKACTFENDTEIKSCSKDSDLISRADAIEALGEEPPVWCDEDYEIAERDQWRTDIEAIKSVPSADRPRHIDPTITVDLESGVVPISACEPKAPKTIVYADRVYAERPRGRWHYSDGKPATIGQSFGVICDQCGTESEYCTNFCGECGADMRGDDK